MEYQRRTVLGDENMTRFKVGNRVLVMPTIFHRHVGDEGTVSRLMPHKSGKRTLDRYEVEFPNGENCILWDIQLSAGMRDEGDFYKSL
jgi:hypothetical protein